MDWSAAREPLVVARAVHFTVTALLVGGIVFDAFVAKPVLQCHVVSFQGKKGRAIWVYLALAVISGGIWLLLQAASMSGLPFNEALTTDVLSTVVNETLFG